MSDNTQTTGSQSEGEEHSSARPNGHSETESDQSVSQSVDREVSNVQPLNQRSRSGLPSGVSETFQKQTTVGQIKSTILIFFATGLGIGIAGFAVVGGAGSISSAGMAGIIASITLIISVITLALTGPILGAVAGTRISSALSDEPAAQTYVTAGVSTAAGHILFFVIAYILISAGASSLGDGGFTPSVGVLLVPIFIGAIGTAITGTMAVYATQSLSVSR